MPGSNESKSQIDVDIGGTFTDAFVTWKDVTVAAKTPTTEYNLSVGFMRAVKEAAKNLDIEPGELIDNTEIIRYSTTIAMNKLLERKGPRLGLICTRGFEDTVIVGKGAQWADGLPVRERRNVARARRPEPLIPRHMTVGVRERTDSQGRVVCPLNEDEVIEKISYLVDRGARGLVVSLLWSYLNPAHEIRIREIFRDLYPDCYLGSMPIILSSEVLPQRFEYTRTLTTILNAYLHQAMWEELMGMSDELRAHGYRHSIMLVHNSGGMAEIFKTSAVQTFNGGPVAGLLGAAYLGGQMAISDLIVADMGGTSFDISLVEAGRPRTSLSQPLIDRWQVGISMLETKSIGAGGGSIAWIDETAGRRVEVGPQSAGAMPGPAAYDLGGRKPTVTDADLVLRYINPDYYHGGRLKLNLRRAQTAIEDKIARPLGLTVEEGAVLIRRLIDAKMGYALFKETSLRGYDPRKLVLFACGGAGPTHCCGVSRYAQVDQIVTFPFSPVFCAFGSANMDVRHTYEQSNRIQLLAAGGTEWLSDFTAFNAIVETLQKKALLDITGEGFAAGQAAFELELDIKFGGQLNIKRILSPRLSLNSSEDVQVLYKNFETEYAGSFSPISLYPAGGVEIHNFILHAHVFRPKIKLPVYPLQGSTPPTEAQKSPRPAYWNEFSDFRETPVFEQDELQPGNIIAGPAILESPHTTTVIPPGWVFSMNEFKAGLIRKEL